MKCITYESINKCYCFALLLLSLTPFDFAKLKTIKTRKLGYNNEVPSVI